MDYTETKENLEQSSVKNIIVSLGEVNNNILTKGINALYNYILSNPKRINCKTADIKHITV